MPEMPIPDLTKPAASSPAPVQAQEPAPSPEPSAPAPEAKVEPPVAASEPQKTQDAPAASSDSKDPKAGLLKAIEKVVAPATDATKAAATSGTGVDTNSAAKPGETAKPAASDTPLPDEVSQDELKAYAPKTRERIQKLLSQREEYKSQVEETVPFRNYMRENDLGVDDLAFSLQALATLRRGDYEGFLNQVQPFIDVAMHHTGRAIPPDLQQAVDRREMTPEAAKYVARQRIDLGNASALVDRSNQERQQQMQEQQDTQFRQANRSAVAAWETQIKASDPDYAKKLDVANAYVASIRAEWGDPQNPQEALEIAKEAYRRASESLKSALPARVATQQQPSSLQRPATSGAQAGPPKTLMEAAMRGLDKARQRAS